MRLPALVLLCSTLFFTGCASMGERAEVKGDAGTATHDVEREDAADKTPANQPMPTKPYDDGGPIVEAPLESAELRIQRCGRIQVSVKGKEIRASREIRRAALRFEAIVMGFKDTEVNLRMASSKLDAFIDFLDSQDGFEVEEYDFSAFDRTMEHFSVEERMERAQASDDKLKELLKAAPSLSELERLEKRLEESRKLLEALRTARLDLSLHAGRVDIKVEIR
jgi:hypothetical protein